MRGGVQIAIVLLSVACSSDPMVDDGGGGTAAAGGAPTTPPDGSYLVAMSTTLEPLAPFVARARTRADVRVNPPALFYVQQHVFLDAADRATPVGATATYVFGPDGQATAELAVPGAANPISGEDVVVDALFTLTQIAPFTCGTLSGRATVDGEPIDIAGSTFALTPLDGADPGALVIDCDGTTLPP